MNSVHLLMYSTHCIYAACMCAMTVSVGSIQNTSLVPSTLLQNCCRHSEDGLGNCVHIPGAVTSHSQIPECQIRSSETVTLHTNDCTALTEETLALVDPATNNRLPLPGTCGTSQMQQDQVPCTAAPYDAYTRGDSSHDFVCLLTSLRQENGRSFPDHLLNSSKHSEEVDWVRD